MLADSNCRGWMPVAWFNDAHPLAQAASLADTHNATKSETRKAPWATQELIHGVTQIKGKVAHPS